MSRRDRPTLKKFFRDGALPSSEHYADLIDSAVNRIDDGFDKSEQDGLRIASLGASPTLMSFYNGAGAAEAAWTMRHARTPGTLHVAPGPEGFHGIPGPTGEAEPPPSLSLSGSRKVGVNVADPEWRLDVDGVARMRGRIGVPGPQAKVPADGRWHDITEHLTGCHAFEIMAGAGGEPGRGRYALMHAVALNAYNPRNPILNWVFGRRSIRRQNAMFGSFADRLRLRWKGTSRDYRLQIRSNSHFGAGIVVRYYITRLWFDTAMQGSRSEILRDEDIA
ncbi:MAG: hypothetical protein AAGG56_15965 [Pseudomonadota bacterium]